MTVAVRRATPEDTPAICGLLAASYDANPKADPAVLRWQYWEDPFGAARSWVAEAAGEVVCHWAAIPVPVRLGGREVPAAKGVDIATHPAYRRRGLFTRVALALLEDCRDAGLEVLLTHPNPASAPAVERAGAALLGRARAYVRPLDAAWLARRLHVPRPLARLGCRLAFPAPEAAAGTRPLPGPPDGLDDLWGQVGAARPAGIVRDAAWWRWRYARRPGGDYRYVETRRGSALAGAAVLTVGERFGGRFALVLELLAPDGEAARPLGAAIASVARAEGAAGVAGIALPGSRQAGLLAAAGLRPLPRRLEPRPLRVMAFTPAAGARARALPAGRAWTVSWGDLDHL